MSTVPPSGPPPPPPPPPPPGMTPPTGVTPPPADAADAPYPARLQIDYPETLNRVTTAFRIILIIPIGIVLSILTNSGGDAIQTDDGEWVTTSGTSILGALFFTTLLMIPVPPAVSEVVVRLPRSNSTGRRPGHRLFRAADRHVPVDRRHPERPSGHRLPGERRARLEPVAPAREVAYRDPPLHHPVLPVDRGVLLRDHRLVRDPLHREVPEGSVRLRRRRRAVEPAGVRLPGCLLVTDRYPPFALD